MHPFHMNTFTWGKLTRVAVTVSSKGYSAYTPWNSKNLLDAVEKRDPRATTDGRVRASIEHTRQATCGLSIRSQKHISWIYATWKSNAHDPNTTRSDTLEEHRQGFNRLLDFPEPEWQSEFYTIRWNRIAACREFRRLRFRSH